MGVKFIMEKKFFAGRFEDKVMIITGGARGIGRATAIRAAKEGAKVVVVDRLKSEGEETLKSIIDNGGDAIFLNLDLSIEENYENMVKETISKYGKLDIAINNASIAGLTGLPGNAAYVASKHAVNGLTKNLASDDSTHMTGATVQTDSGWTSF